MLVVRSQDKIKLIIDNKIYHCVAVYNEFWICTPYLNSKEMKLSSYLTEEEIILGRYSTKEKALKVLDMLEAFINENYEKLHNLGYKQCIVDSQVYGRNHYELTSLSFQFPKDDEVKKC